MPQPDRPPGDLPGGVTVAAVVAAIACCAIPLLVAAGLVTSTGVALRSLALVGVGVALAAWLVLRAVRRARRQQDKGLGAVPPRSYYQSARDEGQPGEE